MKILHAIDSAYITKKSILEFAADLQRFHDSEKVTCPIHQELDVILEKVMTYALESSVGFTHHISHMRSSHREELRKTLIRLGYAVEWEFGPDRERVYLHVSWRRWL